VESDKHLKVIKDGLELVRNHVFGLGLLGVASVASYQDWAVAPGWTAYRLSAVLGMVALVYIVVSTIYFILANQPSKERRRARSLWTIFSVAILVTIAELSSVVVMRHAAWDHAHQSNAAADHSVAVSSSGQASTVK
jgi:heme/copper-type cytochrome/quinol oxidase subunit 4